MSRKRTTYQEPDLSQLDVWDGLGTPGERFAFLAEEAQARHRAREGNQLGGLVLAGLVLMAMKPCATCKRPMRSGRVKAADAPAGSAIQATATECQACAKRERRRGHLIIPTIVEDAPDGDRATVHSMVARRFPAEPDLLRMLGLA